jgi:hypothetical protein
LKHDVTPHKHAGRSLFGSRRRRGRGRGRRLRRCWRWCGRRHASLLLSRSRLSRRAAAPRRARAARLLLLLPTSVPRRPQNLPCALFAPQQMMTKSRRRRRKRRRKVSMLFLSSVARLPPPVPASFDYCSSSAPSSRRHELTPLPCYSTPRFLHRCAAAYHRRPANILS